VRVAAKAVFGHANESDRTCLTGESKVVRMFDVGREQQGDEHFMLDIMFRFESFHWDSYYDFPVSTV
jgi:hypothetical protein